MIHACERDELILCLGWMEVMFLFLAKLNSFKLGKYSSTEWARTGRRPTDLNP
jgi:hypothetical protein